MLKSKKSESSQYELQSNTMLLARRTLLKVAFSIPHSLNTLKLTLIVLSIISVVFFVSPSFTFKNAEARCPNGSHKSPSGDCETVTSHEGLPRCPNGTHRSPDGDCESVDDGGNDDDNVKDDNSNPSSSNNDQSSSNPIVEGSNTLQITKTPYSSTIPSQNTTTAPAPAPPPPPQQQQLQTYKDPQGRFTIQYQSTWQIAPRNSPDGFPYYGTETAIAFKPANESSDPSDHSVFSITPTNVEKFLDKTTLQAKSKSLDQIASDTIEFYKNPPSSLGNLNVEVLKNNVTTIGGLPARQITYLLHDIGTFNMQTYVIKGDRLYTFDLSTTELKVPQIFPEVQQMLKTFHFTNDTMANHQSEQQSTLEQKEQTSSNLTKGSSSNRNIQNTPNRTQAEHSETLQIPTSHPPAVIAPALNTTTAPPPQQQSSFLTYENPTYRFSIQYPSNWSVKEHPEAGRVVSFDEINKGVQVYIKHDKLPSQYATLTQYVNTLVNQLGNDRKDFSLIEHYPNLTLHKNPAYKIVYLSTKKVGVNIGNHYETMRLWMMKGDDVYTLVYVTQPNLFPQYLPIANNMLKSFKITK